MTRSGRCSAAGTRLHLVASMTAHFSLSPPRSGDYGDGMRLSSPAFAPGETVPARHTCDGADVSPPLVIEDIPEGTAALALIMQDPDAPVGTWDHWVAYDIPVASTVPEGVRSLGTPGRNSWGRTGYGGPCPPSGVHRYFLRIYALDARLGLPERAGKQQVLEAMRGHVLAEAALLGHYSRP